jgi:hypothetical protein
VRCELDAFRPAPIKIPIYAQLVSAVLWKQASRRLDPGETATHRKQSLSNGLMADMQIVCEADEIGLDAFINLNACALV